MAYQNNDIEKYLRGELTPAEMHALEQRALKDPFLAEALEGAEQAGAENFSVDLQMLHHTLHKKTRRKGPRVISMNGWGLYVGIAAGLLLLAVSSFILITMIKADRQNIQTAETETLTKPDTVQTATNDSSGIQADSLLAQLKPEETESTASSQNEPRKKSPSRPAATGSVASGTATEQSELERAAEAEAIVEADVTDVTIAPEVQAPIAEDKKAASRQAVPQTSGFITGERIVKGKVLSADDGNPLPGVNVLIKGTSKGTVTNANGEYELPLPDANDELVFSFIGLTSQEVKVTDEKEVTVRMESDVTQLSEMVVTGYGVSNEPAEPSVLEMAEPQGGRKAFKKYLEEQLQYPQQALDNNVEGRVIVQFTVQPNGQLSDFQILKGLGYGCDEEVIRLIKEGPAWEPSKKGDTPVQDNVKIRLKFDLPQK